DGLVDFFDCGRIPAANICTNPPFNRCNEFVLRALELASGKVAMIWLARRLNATRWLQETPLARVYLLTPRPSMPPSHVIAAGEKPGGGSQDFVWLVWEHGHVVKLDNRPMKTSFGVTKLRPEFTIVEWRDLGGERRPQPAQLPPPANKECVDAKNIL